jgi:Beta propeller domain
MEHRRLAAIPLALLSAFAAASSCTATPPPPPKVVVQAPPKATSAQVVAAMTPPPPARKPSPPRPPPPVISSPMPGDPAETNLGEARLITSSCENYRETARKIADERIKQMKADVDDSFRTWHDSQPDCWEESRWRAEEERELLEGSRYRGPMVRSGGYGVGGALGGLPGSVMLGASPSATKKGDSSGSPVRMTKPTTEPPRPPADRAPTRSKPKEGASGEPKAAESASGTNNQVVGVDEADIVKTDGRYVYLSMNGALRIMEALNPKVISVTRMSGDVREMFIEGDRAVVYTASGNRGRPCTYAYDCQFAGDGTSTRITVFDIADRAAPKQVRQIDFSGSLMAARRIGHAIHTVVADNDAQGAHYDSWPAGMDTCGNKEDFVRKEFAKLKIENERKIRQNVWFPTVKEKNVETPMCAGLLETTIKDGQAFTTVSSFDMFDDNTPAMTATIQSRPGAVFASTNTLYLSVVHQKSASRGKWYSFYPNVNEVSEIHAFRIGETPKTTQYMGSGVVPGHVLNQFAMDEWYGYLRVATSKGRVPDPNVHSVLSILAPGKNGNLVRVGAIDKIAPGEDIRAVRFDEDRGYIVTVKKTDPLFVMDLYDPAKPSILGELKIPGFSTYIHRIDPDHLLSIGFDANDHGDFAYFDGVILQLFDVSKPTDPQLVHKEKIGTRGSSSEAATNHLAFNYFADRGLLAIPMTVCEGGRDGVNGNTLAFSGLLVYNVDLDKGFTKLGGVDHGKRGANCGTWWSQANSLVKRSVFLDDLVYSIATDRLKVQRMTSFGFDLADIALMP